MNKERKPQDIVVALKTEENKIERHPRKMSEIARTYHDNIQNNDVPEYNNDYEKQVSEVMATIDKELSEDQKINVGQAFEKTEIQDAIKALKDGKAAGLDGIVHKLWKALNDVFEDRKKNDELGFDIAGALTVVFNDIRDFGIVESTSFAEG